MSAKLRPVWQVNNDYELYFSDYKTADKLSIEDYNLQPAEVDAHAYAKIVMVDLFKLSPLWEGLSPLVVEKIHQRIGEIVDCDSAPL